MNFNRIIFFLMLFASTASNFNTNAQQRQSNINVSDTLIAKESTPKKTNQDTISAKNSILQNALVKESPNSLKKSERKNASTLLETFRKDTLANGMAGDSTHKDTAFSADKNLKPKSIIENTNRITINVLAKNTFINSTDPGTYFLQETRVFPGKEFTFYLLCILLLILAVFKTVYPMYFSNLFRIFFNTSLRQTQLTDQLTQAKFPSFILNIFFTLSAGIYIWLLFNHLQRVQSLPAPTLLFSCILSVAAIYLIKFIILKFMGWIAGIQTTTDNYIFVIFMVNKILGVLLLPFLIMLAFSMNKWIPFITVISALFITLLFLSRYAKSYGALEKKLDIHGLHLFIFVVGAEIIPLCIFYKIAVDYLV